ncbi:MAG: TIM barrel protein [Bacteroidales bacterium]
MKKRSIVILSLGLLLVGACKPDKSTDILERSNIIAWCIVPFDANERGPAERAAMLKELGISKLAYDYRARHIPQFRDEIRILEEEGIELSAVWLWVQAMEDNKLDPDSESIVRIVEETGVNTEFWISFPEEFFGDTDDEAKFQKAVKTIRKLDERFRKYGCSIALYNHGAWFGDPENQIRIIEAIGSETIGIVYNFHHAHHEIDKFETLFPKMLPYLTAVNLNGMIKDGQKIVTIGEGEEELNMIRVVTASGYDGPVGILGHTEGEDIRVVLERNLLGLEEIKRDLEKLPEVQ